LNTYAYAESSPILASDPFGLFRLTTSSSISWVDEIPGSNGRVVGLVLGGVPLGVTTPFIPTRCECNNDCGAWRLGECSSNFYIEVLIRGDLKPHIERATRDAEAEHVGDLRLGSDRMYEAGASAEKSMQATTFASEEDCKNRSKKAIQDALRAVGLELIKKSKVRDQNGGHRYPSAWPYK
jgi:hypothetical protein